MVVENVTSYDASVRNDYTVCVPIQSAGEYALFLTPRHRHLDVVPVLYGTTTMVTKLEAAGLRGAALYPYQHDKTGRTLNPYLQQWRDLLGFGFPFIKAELLRDNPTGEDLSGWRNLVAANGYDVNIITGFLADRFPHAAALKVE